MIALSGIGRTFVVGGHAVHALQDVTLTVADGEYVSIMGPSGSGKSTLLNILGCLDRPTHGSYVLDGEETASLGETELSRVRRHKIGFVFQFFHLIPRLTAAENVALPMLFAGIDPAERNRRAGKALAAVGLEARASHRPDQLSGGERQRAAIARATVMEPGILLADEPTGNLDSASGTEIVKAVEALNAGGITLIVVTHDSSVGRRARRRIRLSDGRIVSDETGPGSGEGASPSGGPALGRRASP
jgi:putative ABC transport system ATP-binding protein